MRRRRVFLLAVLLLGCDGDPSTPDKTEPALSDVTPAANVTGVSLRAPITVRFSESVTVSDSLRFLRLLQGGVDIAGTITRPDRKQIQLTPTELLQPGETYEIVVSGSIVDGGGNRSTISTTSTFTTLGRKADPIDVNALMVHLSRLAHDSMAGRGSGTIDEVRAADYIAQQFQFAGLQPPPGNYVMQFTIPPVRVGGRLGVTSQNVIGVIPGTGSLQNEWIVLGGHYDHVGTRVVSGVSQIYNGADDNASGTALVIQLATQIASYIQSNGLGAEPRRSILFQAFGAEELGLIGSEAYCAQPKYPLNTVMAMLNFDMVGRLRNRTLSIGGLPTAAEWRSMVTRYNQDGLAIAETDCAACTDFACFRRNQRPVLWFFTNTHEDYHRPTDDTALINTEGITQIGNLALRITLDLAIRPRAPAFTP